MELMKVQRKRIYINKITNKWYSNRFDCYDFFEVMIQQQKNSPYTPSVAMVNMRK